MGKKIEEPKDVFQGCETPQNAGFHSALLLALPAFGGGTVPARNKNALPNILWLFVSKMGCITYAFK